MPHFAHPDISLSADFVHHAVRTSNAIVLLSPTSRGASRSCVCASAELTLHIGSFDDFFESPKDDEQGAAPIAVGFNGFFRGAFS